jgi:hypothetical protein
MTYLGMQLDGDLSSSLMPKNRIELIESDEFLLYPLFPLVIVTQFKSKGQLQNRRNTLINGEWSII